MKYIPLRSLPLLREFPELIKTSPAMDFAEALYCLENKEYFEYFKIINAQGVEVILDNSAYLIGEALPFQLLLNLTEDFEHPDHVIAVVPDFVVDYETTLRKARQCVEQASELSPTSRPQLMAVPHGDSLEEYDELMREYLNIPGIDWLGITLPWDRDKLIQFHKDLVEDGDCEEWSTSVLFADTRNLLITHLDWNGLLHPRRKYHLLGMGSLEELKHYRHYGLPKVIISCDSSIAYAAGKEGQDLSLVTEDYTPDEELEHDDELQGEKLRLARKNAVYVSRICEDIPRSE